MNRIILSLALLPIGAMAADDHLAFFETEIRPLLSAECFDCHGPEKSKAGLRLDHRDLILKGGDSGAAIVAGKPDESLLVEAIRREDPDFSMPPKKALTENQVAALEKWVALGAPWPEEQITRSETDENGFTAEDRAWWAVQPLADAKPPQAGSDWARNDIDRFVYAKLEEKNLEPAEVASAAELLRRMVFDVHGLPPTEEQSEAFALAYSKDPDKAVADLADELLASPRYGERWGQHWLDVVRYAESDGYRADFFRPDAWRYRDYVIDSFNTNKPYDQFVREQLAADEFAADDPDALIGTAFLRHGIYEYNQRNARMHWELIVNEMTNVTGEVFLGLGIGCAQCHDHKFDPILQKDYFALQSFLATTWWPEDRVLATPEEFAAHEKAMAEWEKSTGEIQAELDELLQPLLESKQKGQAKQFPADVQEMYWKPASEQTPYEKQIAELVERQVRWSQSKIEAEKSFAKDEKKLKKYQDLKKRLAEAEKKKPEALPTAFISTDISKTPAKTFLKTRQGEEIVEPAFLTLLGQPAPEIEPTDETTGRRLALANWIASEDNPFSTRVIVNRIWQRHFGTGLVETPNDFGRLGEEPSHPELLDWLTRQFLAGGWKMKPIHKLVLTSATYRQTARREPTSTEELTDPANRLLWRFPPERLEAEQIRDAMLLVSGELKHRDGGSSVDGSAPNRSVFVKRRRNTVEPMMGGFDAPAGFASTPNRIATTTPNQSLMLVNGEFAMDRAQAFAKRVLGGKNEITADDVRRAFRIAYGREPETHEVEGALAFIESQSGRIDAPVPEFKYPDENGLRPVSQHFGGVKDIELGESTLWLQPESRFEKLQLHGIDFPGDSFTIEAVTILDRIYSDASVNTLFSQWNGSQHSSGWNLGITSEKSRYQPRNFIMQLIGDDFQGVRSYEVVASDLRFPLNKPVYIAAAISAEPSPDDQTKGTVTFYLKDLSDSKAPLQTQTVAHEIVGGVSAEEGIKMLIGGRDQAGHLWDGQLARLVVSKGTLQAKELIINEGSKKAVLDFQFGEVQKKFAGVEDPGYQHGPPMPNTDWVRNSSDRKSSGYPPRLFGAVTDFCHALLTSNEFLYLH